MPSKPRTEQHTVTTPDGWELSVYRLRPRHGTPRGTPVLFVPGYGMNSYLFRHDHDGPSFMSALADAGFDPWSIDTRGARTTKPRRKAGPVDLAHQAFVDLPTAAAYIRQQSGHDRLHGVGCSLGGVLLYAWGAGDRNHQMDRLVTLGTPLVWPNGGLVPRAFKAASPVLGALPLRGSRPLARVGLPIAATLAPFALKIYLNPRITRTRKTGGLTDTVENPIPALNRQIAQWMRDQHLLLDGFHLTESLASFDRPTLVAWGDNDGICPPVAAQAALEVLPNATPMEVRHPSGHGVSHADLFICNGVNELVYQPVADFLGP